MLFFLPITPPTPHPPQILFEEVLTNLDGTDLENLRRCSGYRLRLNTLSLADHHLYLAMLQALSLIPKQTRLKKEFEYRWTGIQIGKNIGKSDSCIQSSRGRFEKTILMWRIALLRANESLHSDKGWKESVEGLKEACSILTFAARDLEGDPLELKYLECNPAVVRAVAQSMLAEAGFVMLEGLSATLAPENTARLACEVRILFAEALAIFESVREVSPEVMASAYARERLMLARSMRFTAAIKEGGDAEALLFHAANVMRHALGQIGHASKGSLADRSAELAAEENLCEREFQVAKKANSLIFMTRTDCEPTNLLPKPSEIIKSPKQFELPEPGFVLNLTSAV